jgi:hypothetical protein
MWKERPRCMGGSWKGLSTGDISYLKKEIKYCKNPMEKRHLQKVLQEIHKNGIA